MDKDTKQHEYEKKFLKVFEKQSDAIFRFCFYKVSNRAKAQDITQDTFMRCWQRLVVGDEIKNIKAFLFTVARNLIIDHYRKQTNLSLEEISDQGFEPAINENNSEKVDSKMAFDKVLQLLSKIDEKYRDAVLLRYVEDLKPKEIAEILGESENVVSVRIHRGVEKLRKLI